MTPWNASINVHNVAGPKRPRRPSRRTASAPSHPFRNGARRSPKLRSVIETGVGHLTPLREDVPWETCRMLTEEAAGGLTKRATSAPPVIAFAASSMDPDTMPGVMIESGNGRLSRREVSPGWDFCSESSEICSSMWEVLSEATTSSWVDVPLQHENNLTNPMSPPMVAKDISSPVVAKDTTAKPAQKDKSISFADMLRGGGNNGGGKSQISTASIRTAVPTAVRPPAGGVARPPPVISPCRKPIAGMANKQEPASTFDSDSGEEPCLWDRDSRAHGWRKSHKAPRSIKNRVKVASQTARRAEQSKLSRTNCAS